MSLYGDYILERENQGIVESEYGFATYQVSGHECYIKDIYVIPEMRTSGLASKMADKIAGLAKEKGCTYLSGSVCPSTNNSTSSLKVLLAYGFKLAKSDVNMIWLIKELQ